MKKSLLIAISFLTYSLGILAQNSIQLNINHMLGDANFALNTGAKNNINDDFEVTRLQYYISEISIVHDNGQETSIDDLWILVDVSATTQVDLGSYDVNSVEMVKLHIGVNEEQNHLDPSTYPPSHPLALSSPSMHWGWTAGYRFVAIEGYGSSMYDQLFQLHALGDRNYFTTEIPVTTEASNNEVVLILDADYTRALEDINVRNGVIVHGDDDEAMQCLENFRDYVFTPGSVITSTVDFSEIGKFEVFPNPTNGHATITLETDKDLNYQIAVTNILGEQVAFFNDVNSNVNIDLDLQQSGFYFINLIKEGQPVITKKLISK